MSASTFIKISSASRLGKARFRGFLGLPQGKRTLTPLRRKMTLITPERKKEGHIGREKAAPYAKKETNLAKRRQRLDLCAAATPAASPIKEVFPTRFENLI